MFAIPVILGSVTTPESDSGPDFVKATFGKTSQSDDIYPLFTYTYAY
jgi:hypothetical protein